ncbi:MAG: OmpP1/FadL family transporter, partial [Deltaproteobacteria bacterium]
LVHRGLSLTRRLLPALRRGLRGFLAALLLGAVVSARARANPLDTYGAGPEGQAMAGARTALDLGGAGAYYDPALLAMATEARLDLGVAELGSNLVYNGQSAGGGSFSGGTLGLVLPLGGKLRGLALGLYGLFPSGDLGHVVSQGGEAPQFVQYGALQRFVLYGALAGKVGPVAAGLGVQGLNSAQGALSLDEDFASGTIGARSLTLDLVPRAALDLGLAVDATDALRFAGSYRGPSEVGLTLPSNVDLGPLAFDLSLSALSFYRPPTWTLAGAWHEAGFTADVEASYLQWSQAPDPALTATFAPSTPLLPDLASQPTGVAFHDTVVFRAGGSYRLGSVASLLAGYQYAPSPVPAQTGPSNLLDCDRHEFAAGLSFDFADPTELSSGPASLVLAGQYHLLVTREAIKQDPLDPVGDGIYGGSLWLASASLVLRFGGPK